MPQSSIFHWPAGAGWFILSGGSLEAGANANVDARMLTRGAGFGSLAYIWAAASLEIAEEHLDYYNDLGGPPGYTVDIIAEDDDTIAAQLTEAGIIVIGDGPDSTRLFNALHGAAIKAIQLAHQRGALIVGLGIGAEPFGQWFLPPAASAAEAATRPGFGWLSNAALMAGPKHERRQQALQTLLNEEPLAYGLGIGADSALVLGPEGEVELWGNQNLSIALGQGYTVQE